MNRVTVVIPTALRPFTNGVAEISVTADTLGQALSEIEQRHPGLCARILTPEGDIRPFVNLFVGDTSARFMDGLDTPVAEGTIISIIPAVAGGSRCAGAGRRPQPANRLRAIIMRWISLVPSTIRMTRRDR